MALVAVVLLAPVVLLTLGVQEAGATPSRPPTAASYFIASYDKNTAFSDGKAQGKADASSGYDSAVILDFGWQISGGTETPNTYVDLTYSQVENMGIAFAEGYMAGVGSADTYDALEIGTVNYGSFFASDPTARGKTWGDAVNTIYTDVLNDGYDQVIVDGGSDLEPGYSTQNDTEDWAQGFADTASEPYADYGSADGCVRTPEGSDGPCNNNWSISGEYYLAWAAADAMATPLMTVSDQQDQWANISDYGKQNSTDGMIYWLGITDTYPSGWDATTAWNDFYSALSNYGVATTPSYSLQLSSEME